MRRETETVLRNLHLEIGEPCNGFWAYLLRGITYPLERGEREAYLGLFYRLEQELAAMYGGSPEILLHIWQLHHEDGSQQLSKNGRAWAPVIGMGIWPHHPPPTLWTKEELDNLAPGEVPRPPLFMVARLKESPKRRSEILSLMGGRGTVIEFGVQGDVEIFYRQCQEYFRTFITEPIHAAYPFFFPLMDAQTLPSSTPELVARILGSVRDYLRESPEDGGILLLSRNEFHRYFEELGYPIRLHE